MINSRSPITNKDKNTFFKTMNGTKKITTSLQVVFKMSDSYVLFTEKLSESTLNSALLFNY